MVSNRIKYQVVQFTMNVPFVFLKECLTLFYIHQSVEGSRETLVQSEDSTSRTSESVPIKKKKKRVRSAVLNHRAKIYIFTNNN